MREEKIQLEADEKILIRVRKHWFLILVQMLLIVLSALLPFFLYAMFVGTYTPETEEGTLLGNALVTLYAGWLLIMWMAIFSVWTNYYLDVWTVTNKRLIAVDQKGFFFRTTASFRLERLQDIIVSVDGIVATLLDYGSLEIQTAGDDKNFKAYGLPSPGDIKSTILSSADTLIARESNPQNTGM